MLNRRTVLLALGAFALAALCVRLGFWQWDRMEDKKEQQATIERHLTAKPVPLESVLVPGREVTEAQEWMRVQATGRFETRNQVTVKFTTREGQAGADVVTPFVMDGGTGILVNRGWMATSNTNERPTDIPAPPPGRVTIEGWLRPNSTAPSNATRPFDGQVRAVSSRGLSDRTDADLLAGYLNVQSPASEGLSPEPAPRVGHYLNFFYALQWWFFAVLAFVGPFWFAREPHAKPQASAIKSA